MNRDAKCISRSLRPDIERVKSCIRDNAFGRRCMFDGDGFVFKTALKEMRAELLKSGIRIKYERKGAVYVFENS